MRDFKVKYIRTLAPNKLRYCINIFTDLQQTLFCLLFTQMLLLSVEPL